MSIYPQKYGFVYIWYDKKKKRYYIGSHWGTENDGYICSSNWMYKTYKRRPHDFKRRIITRVYTNRIDLLTEEQRWLSFIKDEELATKNTTLVKRKNVRYYNFNKNVNNPWHSTEVGIKTIGEKISAAKKGKSNGPCSPEKAQAISEAKKKKFAERGGITEEHRLAIQQAAKNRNHKHTDEWKAENSKRMSQQWNDINNTRRQAVSLATKKRWEEYRRMKQDQLVK